MRDPNQQLADAIDDATWTASCEAGRETLLAAIRGDELPAFPDVLVHALYEADYEIGKAWERLPDGAAQWLRKGDSAKLDEARTAVEHLTAAAFAILDRLSAEVS